MQLKTLHIFITCIIICDAGKQELEMLMSLNAYKMNADIMNYGL